LLRRFVGEVFLFEDIPTGDRKLAEAKVLAIILRVGRGTFKAGR